MRGLFPQSGRLSPALPVIYAVSCIPRIKSRIALNRVRYVAIFEGEPLEPTVPMEEPGDGLAQFNWVAILLPLGVVFAVGGVIGACLFVKRRREFKEEDTE